MPEVLARNPVLPLRTREGRALRVAHLTTVDMSLALLLRTELEVDVSAGFETFGLSASGKYLDTIRSTGATHISVDSLTRAWNPRRDFAAARELLRALGQLKPDVLHTHNPKTGVLGRVIGRIVGIPVIVNTCHGLWAAPEDKRYKRFLVYAAEVLAASASDAELYQNADDHASLRRWVRQRKAHVVGNGTDLLRFTPDPRARAEVRAQLGIEEDQLLVGGVGRLVDEKGVGEFFGMARQLAGKAKFIWVGPTDPEKSNTPTKLDDAVLLVGERSDMEAVYNALDIFVLPSYREGFSRSAMEAAACETAMVLSDIRGCREIGRHEHELLLVPPRDVAALTVQVERLLQDGALRARLASAARQRALAEFDQRQVAAASLAAYAQAARRKRLGWIHDEVT